MKIRRTQSSGSNQFILWISSVLREQWRTGVNISAWQRKRRYEPILLWSASFWPSWNQKKHNSWNLFRHEQLETGCKDGEHLCRQYSVLQYYPKAQALQTFPEGTVIGLVVKVHIVKILDEYGIGVAIPSIASQPHTSYVVISREKQSVWWTTFIITKTSPSPMTNCSQNFTDQEEMSPMKKGGISSNKKTWTNLSSMCGVSRSHYWPRSPSGSRAGFGTWTSCGQRWRASGRAGRGTTEKGRRGSRWREREANTTQNTQCADDHACMEWRALDDLSHDVTQCELMICTQVLRSECCARSCARLCPMLCIVMCSSMFMT